jgi:hypothetical protein
MLLTARRGPGFAFLNVLRFCCQGLSKRSNVRHESESNPQGCRAYREPKRVAPRRVVRDTQTVPNGAQNSFCYVSQPSPFDSGPFKAGGARHRE